MNNEFLSFLNELMAANPELTEQLMTKNIENYITILADQKDKPALTENGRNILKFLQKEIPEGPFKAVDVATGLGVTSRGITGSLRKLVTDGFCAKIGKDPIIYELTEKGKNFNID